jgi:AmmeMemoRadiSam system protein A
VHFQETYDEALVQAIERKAKENNFPAGTLGQREKALDHGTMVPLYFIRKKYTNFKLVRIGLSGLPLEDHYRLGQIIQRAVGETERRVVYIASGDLSHKLQSYGPYGFAAEGPVYDARIMDVCSRAAFGELFDFDETFCEHAAECGHRSFVIMAGALDGTAVKAETYSHQDVTGVGYGICSFYPEGPDPERQFRKAYLSEMEQKVMEMNQRSDPYVKLARRSLESYILHGKTVELPEDLPPEMYTQKAGAFVSIHKEGQLRGCIGTILPTEDSVALEIIQNAISASVRDPRFSPIRPDELPLLEIHVDVLGEPEDIDSEEELDVKRYGVIVQKGGRRGLLLPDLPGVDTVEEQIDIAKRKAGIGPEEKVRLQRFEVVRHL